MTAAYTPDFIAAFKEAAKETFRFLTYDHLNRYHFVMPTLDEIKADLDQVSPSMNPHQAEDSLAIHDKHHNKTGEVLFSHPDFSTPADIKTFDNVMRTNAPSALPFQRMYAQTLPDLFDTPDQMLPIQQRKNLRERAYAFNIDLSLNKEQQQAAQEESRRRQIAERQAAWDANVDPLEHEKNAFAEASVRTTDGRTAFLMTLATISKNHLEKLTCEPERAAELRLYGTWFHKYLDLKIEGKTDAEIFPLEIDLPEPFLQSLRQERSELKQQQTSAPAPAPGQ